MVTDFNVAAWHGMCSAAGYLGVSYLFQRADVVLQVCEGEGVAVCQMDNIMVTWELYGECERVVGLALAACDCVGAIAHTGATAHPADPLQHTCEVVNA